MRKTIAVLAMAALTAGCAKQMSAEEARTAIPEASKVFIDTPKDAADASAAAQKIRATADGAEPSTPVFHPGFLTLTNSDFAKWSYVTAWTVNGGTWWTLTLVKVITTFPATTCTDDTCTWGPWDDESKVTPGLAIKRWQLTVRKVSDAEYTYVLAAMNLVDPGPFLPIVSGVARPAGPGTGSGSIVLSFDNARLLPEAEDDAGVLSIEYDNTASPAWITAQIVGGVDENNGRPIDAAYAFEASATGGDLQVAFEGEDEQANPIALSLHTRWDGTGAGRGDARIIVQDAGGLWSFTGGASECWAGAAGLFQLAWDTDPAFGEQAACADAFEGEPQYSTLVVPSAVP